MYENLFIPENRMERYKCIYCKKYGHLEKFYYRKENELAFQKRKHTLTTNFIKFHKEGFPKNNTNHQGPKKIWYPKCNTPFSQHKNFTYKSEYST